MQSPWNPTDEEIRAWAYAPRSLAPVQDWDLALSTARRDALYLALAADDACPKRGYFLRVLYLIVGDAVRTQFRTAARSDIETLLARADAHPHPDLARWQARARALLASPDRFDYDAWCAGGLARDTGDSRSGTA